MVGLDREYFRQREQQKGHLGKQKMFSVRGMCVCQGNGVGLVKGNAGERYRIEIMQGCKLFKKL